jgi:hypothetical protein
MTRTVLIAVALATLVAGCGEQGPSEADIARGDLIAADPVFGEVLDRPVGIETGVIYGVDPLHPSDVLEVTRSWLSDGTTDHEAVAQLVEVALDAGWIEITVECDHLGAARVAAKKMFNDGVDFPVGLVMYGPYEGDPSDTIPPRTHVTAFAARPGYPQQAAISEDTPVIVDLACLEPLISR